ncbi:MAG: hypothetical protein IJ814_03090 [Paludibacteraceae bacterium]|nr:hypothetical protein [Paludibacteraceae bacterium]
MNKRIHIVLTRLFIAVLCPCSLLLAPSCNPEPTWETKDVEVRMDIKNISAGFVECEFSTNKDAYYLTAICQPWTDFNPMANQKQFMQLALDSAYAEYLFWRNDLLRSKEQNVAPFSSHSLQYGLQHHFFTGLLPEEDYWVFCFPVDPVAMKPAGQLKLIPVRTLTDSKMDIHFEYRIKGAWDYVYPVDSTGRINEHFPYIVTTRDSLTLAADSCFSIEEVALYFVLWSTERFLTPELADVHYGVYAVNNDGLQSSEVFQEGHTYYTALSGYDGSFKQTTIYRFVWTGDSCNYYFHDTDPANIINLIQSE